MKNSLNYQLKIRIENISRINKAMHKKRMIHKELERRERQINLENEIAEDGNIRDKRLL